jgi:hypothetical protein
VRAVGVNLSHQLGKRFSGYSGTKISHQGTLPIRADCCDLMAFWPGGGDFIRDHAGSIARRDERGMVPEMGPEVATKGRTDPPKRPRTVIPRSPATGSATVWNPRADSQWRFMRRQTVAVRRHDDPAQPFLCPGFRRLIRITLRSRETLPQTAGSKRQPNGAGRLGEASGAAWPLVVDVTIRVALMARV